MMEYDIKKYMCLSSKGHGHMNHQAGRTALAHLTWLINLQAFVQEMLQQAFWELIAMA